jgi:hypothetical protein
MNTCLHHDCAVVGTTALFEVVEPLLQGIERRLCQEEFYTICLSMLEAFEKHRRRELIWAEHSSN